MIRIVLAAVLAVALLAVSLPAVENAQTDRTDEIVRSDLESLDAAALNLYTNDELVEGPDARRIVTVRIPERSWSAAAVDRVVIHGENETLTYRIDGQPTRHVPANARLARPDRGPLVLDAPGEHRLVLRLVEHEGVSVVVVERYEEYVRRTF